VYIFGTIHEKCCKNRVKENTLLNCIVILLLVRLIFSKKKVNIFVNHDVIMKYTAIIYLEVVCFPWCDNHMILKCTLVW